MTARIGMALAAVLLLAAPVAAQATTYVNEDFEGYANTDAFLAQWVPTNGSGTAALATSDPNYFAGILTSDPLSAGIPNTEGVAVDHVGVRSGSMLNQYGGPFDPALGQGPEFSAVPTATHSVFFSADFYLNNSGNQRMSVGLRGVFPDGADPDTANDTQNLIEMGTWNANPTVLGVPNTAQVSANFAVRAQLFGVTSPNVNPDWQYFQLPQELDRIDDLDQIVNVGDIGAGWHTYAATITPSTITFTIDLYRDGKRNTATAIDPETGERPGTVGEFDGSFTVNVNTSANGFNSLRIGGPSGGISNAGLFGYDNILVSLIEANVPDEDDADFDGDGDVDGQDFLTWQRGNGLAGDLADGDANGDDAVNGLDLTVWKNQFGQSGGAAASAAAIPEPTSIAIAALAILAGVSVTRRR